MTTEQDRHDYIEEGEQSYKRWQQKLQASPHYQVIYEEEAAKSELWLQLVEARQAAGFTQAEIARRLGVSQAQVARIEKRGYDCYTLNTLRRCLQALGDDAQTAPIRYFNSYCRTRLTNVQPSVIVTILAQSALTTQHFGKGYGSMEKTIAAFTVRRQFGKVLEEVFAKGDRFIVERHGERIAAVVPIEVYEQWKKAHNEFFDRLRVASERANLTPEEADQIASTAVNEVRASS